MESRWVRPLVLTFNNYQPGRWCHASISSLTTNLRPASSGNRVHESTHIWPYYYLKYDSLANQSDARNLCTHSALQSEPVLRKVLILKELEGDHSYWKRVDNLCKISRNETNFISAYLRTYLAEYGRSMWVRTILETQNFFWSFSFLASKDGISHFTEVLSRRERKRPNPYGVCTGCKGAVTLISTKSKKRQDSNWHRECYEGERQNTEARLVSIGGSWVQKM